MKEGISACRGTESGADLNTMGAILAMLGWQLQDTSACLRALRAAAFSERDIQMYLGDARAIARGMLQIRRLRELRKALHAAKPSC
jgi:hypothetical protein